MRAVSKIYYLYIHININEVGSVQQYPWWYRFNKFFNREGVFPFPLKLARVVLIYKTGSKKDVKNVRPNSTIRFIIKIYERIIHSRLLNYSDKFYPSTIKYITERFFTFCYNASSSLIVDMFRPSGTPQYNPKFEKNIH